MSKTSVSDEDEMFNFVKNEIWSEGITNLLFNYFSIISAVITNFLLINISFLVNHELKEIPFKKTAVETMCLFICSVCA